MKYEQIEMKKWWNRRISKRECVIW